MPLRYEGRTVYFEGSCTVEEALPLLEFLLNPGPATAVMGDCTSLHSALLQVLAAAQLEPTVPPANPWLSDSLSQLTARSDDA